MKKRILAMTCAAAVAAAAVPVYGAEETAAEPAQSAEETVATNLGVMVNEEPVEFSGQQPVIVDNVTLVPVRGVLETLGVTVAWDAETHTITLTEGKKTGTLTMNRMTVTALCEPFAVVDAAENSPSAPLMNAMGLCNDAVPAQNEQGETVLAGDPTETALLACANRWGFDGPAAQTATPRVDELPFDSDVKRMATVHLLAQDRYAVYVKGGLDEVLALCVNVREGESVRPLTEEDRIRIQASAAEMASNALRVLAFATRETASLAAPGDRTAYESGLTFLGMAGMIDPPRPTAREAVARCRRAGIKPVMITGDHRLTASAIAGDLGILEKQDRVLTGQDLDRMDDERLREEVRDIAVYARVSPEHKVRIVKAWQSWGDVVAMTGDGVNDAPALKRADIGVAMGQTGTEVSKEAAAMILTDDNFATIVGAVAQGRVLYMNILKAIQFLLSSNLGEVLLIFIATVLNLGTPLLPIHILWVNLATATLPALALGVDPASKNIMKHPPVKSGTLFEKDLVRRVVTQGLFVAAMTTCAYWLGVRMEGHATGQTMAFCVLAFSQMLHAFNQCSNTEPIWVRSEGANPYLVLSFAISALLMAGILGIPALRDAFSLTLLQGAQWLATIALAALSLAQVELAKAIARHRKRSR